VQQGSNVVLLKPRLPEYLDRLALRVLGSSKDLQGRGMRTDRRGSNKGAPRHIQPSGVVVWSGN
jgi:hypothetical protein